LLETYRRIGVKVMGNGRQQIEMRVKGEEIIFIEQA
jgi:hypothetical protein